MKCRNCLRRTLARKLCWKCRRDPAVRRLYVRCAPGARWLPRGNHAETQGAVQALQPQARE